MDEIAITTSWDDGHPLDMRIAEMLAQREMAGTFYLTRSFPGMARMPSRDIRELAQVSGIEIAAHTISHPDLPRLSPAQAAAEIQGGKHWLEDLIGWEVRGFAYPRGLHNARLRRQVAEAGYAYARTVRSGHTACCEDAYLMPTSMQMYPHTRVSQLRHALRERDIRGVRNLATLRGWSRNPGVLLDSMASQAGRPASLHIWGHSWEIEALGHWRVLADTLDAARELGTSFGTNYRVHLSQSGIT